MCKDKLSLSHYSINITKMTNVKKPNDKLKITTRVKYL